jgi:hypothetical protein
MKKFPNKLYVKYEDDGDGGLFLQADDDPAIHAEVNGKVRVGVYELKCSTVVTAKVEVA